MANYTVCQSKWKPIVEPRRAKPKTYRQAPTHSKRPGPIFGKRFLFVWPETSQSRFKIQFYFDPKRPGLNFKIKIPFVWF